MVPPSPAAKTSPAVVPVPSQTEFSDCETMLLASMPQVIPTRCMMRPLAPTAYTSVLLPETPNSVSGVRPMASWFQVTPLLRTR